MAVDIAKKQKIEPPLDFSIKSPGIFHPHSPFPNMVIMMNSYGYDFKIINDAGYDDGIFYSDELEDITEEVYRKYLAYYPWAKEEIYEPKNE